MGLQRDGSLVLVNYAACGCAGVLYKVSFWIGVLLLWVLVGAYVFVGILYLGLVQG